MHRSSVGKFFCVGLGLALLIGCATGLEEDPQSVSSLSSEPLDSGVDPDAPSTRLPPPSSSSGGEPEEDSGTGDPDASKTEGGTDAGTDSGPPPPPPPPPTTCAAPAACAGATDLGTISGDTGAGVKSATGATSQWFKIRLSEDDSDVFGVSMQMRATLISPAGSNFDLHVYRAGGSSGVECSSITQSATTAGTDVVSMEWGETGTFSNGNDDDRWVTVEVRHVSGTCSASNKWTLTINGNTK
ncbi:MAG: hypothetical protein JST00_31010 [Deltaproteobacteria bacterium]|nr:hypothetical protein [Deltaproteobacteria bacterium]